MSLEPRKIPETSNRTLLISKGHLDTIISHLSDDGGRAKREAEAKAKAKLREASKKMTDTWNDYPATAWKRQLEEIRKKEEALNEERQRIDDLEGRFQELRRKYVIDMAERRRYEETDRVKLLKQAVLLAETVKENDELRQQSDKKHIFDALDAEYDLCTMIDTEKAQAESIEQIKREREMKQKHASQLKKQQKSIEARKEACRRIELEMGRMIADMEDDYKKQGLAGRKEELEKHLAYRAGLDEQITEQNRLGVVLQKISEAEDKQCEIFNDAKLKMAQKYKEMEAERQKVKDGQIKSISNHLRTLMDEAGETEETNLEKAIQEKEKQIQEQELAEKKAREEAQKERLESWKQNIETKERNKLQEKAQNLDMHFKKEELSERLQKLEEAKERAKLEQNKYAEHTLLHQMALNMANRSKALKEKKQELDRHMASLRQEEETFQKYLSQVIKECKKKGLDINIIKKAVLPSIDGGAGSSGVEKKAYVALSETKRRLGFTSE